MHGRGFQPAAGLRSLRPESTTSSSTRDGNQKSGKAARKKFRWDNCWPRRRSSSFVGTSAAGRRRSSAVSRRGRRTSSTSPSQRALQDLRLRRRPRKHRRWPSTTPTRSSFPFCMCLQLSKEELLAVLSMPDKKFLLSMRREAKFLHKAGAFVQCSLPSLERQVAKVSHGLRSRTSIVPLFFFFFFCSPLPFHSSKRRHEPSPALLDFQKKQIRVV